MSEAQGQLFHLPQKYEVDRATVHPPEVVALGDKLHDEGLVEEAQELLCVSERYIRAMGYYAALLTPPPDSAA